MVRVFLFGEAEKGRYRTPLLIHQLPQLLETFGNPPQDTFGIPCAVQALLFQREVLFFRVEAEGFSKEDYLKGAHYLGKDGQGLNIAAICLPGVGDTTIVESLTPVCKQLSSLLILSEGDLFDYLTSK